MHFVVYVRLTQRDIAAWGQVGVGLVPSCCCLIFVQKQAYGNGDKMTIFVESIDMLCCAKEIKNL
jgi:hypothetical protein